MARLSLLLLSACAVPVTAAPALTCTTRRNDYFEKGKADLQLIECMSSEELYVTGFGGTGPFLSSISAAELTAAGVADDVNFGKPFSMGSQAFPGVSMMWPGNFVLKCGDKTMKDGVVEGFPVDYVFISPPATEPLDSVMAGFGAKVPKVKLAAKKVAAVFFSSSTAGMLGPGQSHPISSADWEACVTAGTATFGFTGADQTAAQGPEGMPPRYTFTDSAKTPVPATVVATITKEKLASECTADGAAAVANDLNALLKDMDVATSRLGLYGLRSSQNALTGRRGYSQCIALVNGMYKTVLEDVTLPGSKACMVPKTDASWATDPCCNPILQWSQCCAPRSATAKARKCANVDGVCTINEPGMAQCKAEYKSTVATYVKEIVAPSVWETEHPEYGCDITAAKAANDKMWVRLIAWVQTCNEQITHGKSKQNRHQCSSGEDCWSGKCDFSTCAKIAGPGSIEPMFRCMLLNADTKIQNYIAADLGYDPKNITTSTPGADSGFVAALDKFRTAIADLNCAGSEGDWCTNSLTRAQCEKLSVTTGEQYGAMNVKWVDDPSSTDTSVGWCKQGTQHYTCPSCGEDGGQQCQCGYGGMFSYQGDAVAQTACNAATSSISGCVPAGELNSLSPSDFKEDQSSCEEALGAWVNYGAGTYHRISTLKTWIKDLETNEYSEKFLTGSQAKCEAEKGCNWDPWGDMGGATEALCLGKPGVAGTGASDGKQMFCGQCQTPSECRERMSLGTCAVKPWEWGSEADCQANRGTDESDDAVYVAEPWKTRGDRVHYKCMRITAAHDSLAECMPPAVCPASAVDEGGNTFNDCSGSFCYDPLVTNRDDCTGLNLDWHPDWRGHMKNNAGLCMYHALRDKASCEAEVGMKWWEGRAWIGGMLDSQTKCETGFCEDGLPGQEQRTTCGKSRKCTKKCKLCISHEREDKSKNRMCYDKSIATSGACTTAGYTWDAAAEKCKKTAFSSDDATCTGLGANHVYKDCNMFAKAQCQSGCHLSAFKTRTACNSASGLSGSRAEWEWDTQMCMAKGFEANYATKNADYPSTAQCAAAGAGTPAFFGTDNDDYKLMSAMGCHWQEHADCPSETSCEAAGDCSDWDLERWATDGSSRASSSCVREPEQWETDGENYRAGERKWCDQYSPPLDHAGAMGCIDNKIVTESACTALGAGWSWMTRASTSTQCAAHGGICQNKFMDWEIYGGIATQKACEACGDTHMWQKAAHWDGGAWQQPSMFKGEWKPRAWASKRSWVATVADYKLTELADRAVARMFGKVYATQIVCKLGPLVKPLKVIGCGCGTGTPSSPSTCKGGLAGILEVPLAKAKVFCGNMGDTAPLASAAGSIVYDVDSSCSVLGDSFADVQMAKIVVANWGDTKDFLVGKTTEDGAVVVDANLGRRLGESGRRLSKCSSHEVITNSVGGITGQKMGTALSTQIAKVHLCMSTNVPTSETCAEYDQLDFAHVHANGTISSPLDLTVTVDAQGRYCGKTTVAGTYIPIKALAKAKRDAVAAPNTGSNGTGSNGTGSNDTAGGTPAAGALTTSPTIFSSGLTFKAKDAAEAEAFVKSSASKGVMACAIADATKKVTCTMVKVTSLTAGGGRRLSDSARRLAGNTITCKYTVTFPKGFAGTPTLTSASLDTAVLATKIKEKAAAAGLTVTVSDVAAQDIVPASTGGTTSGGEPIASSAVGLFLSIGIMIVATLQTVA